MSLANTKNEKKKINLTLDTYDRLKDFSRLNGLKLRSVIDAMVDVILADAALSKRIIELSVEQETAEE
jgi:hypothetical protein